VLLLALAAAGLLGVFALVANYVSDVDTQVGPKVSVLVLSKDVKKNDAISDDMMTEQQVPRRWAPKSALNRSQVIGLVAGSDLARNSILQEGMLVSPPQLAQNEREVAILVDASTGVAGKIEQDSRVDIIAAYPGDQNDAAKPNRSVVVVAGARVLAVGQPRLKSSGGVQDGGSQADPTQVVPVTFALTKPQELQVSYAQSFAQDVRLALLPPGENATRTLDETIFKGDDPKTGAKDEGCQGGC
jgi:pilus assembly protein CpaB